jgi:hypothetical protein
MQDKSIAFIDSVQGTIDVIAGLVGKGILPDDIKKHIRKDTIEIEGDFGLTAIQAQKLRQVFENVYDISAQLGHEDSV